MRKILFLSVVVVLLSLSMACSKAKQQPPAAPLPDVSIAVAGFTQPRSMDDLLAGVMFSEQEFVGDKVLMELDEEFKQVLAAESERSFMNIATTQAWRAKAGQVEKAGKSALDYWVGVGSALGADMILVPQLTYWHALEGSAMGAESPSSVTMDFYLIDVKRAQLINRYHFEETQHSLTDNLLDIGKFVSRHGKWVTANELAAEGMRQAVQELGL
ncbi:MAG: hypothetical protein IJD04_08560 [Desulfovibrionaceae bacterium]|nr:hypothetical protein [Desulfovibrionaceae bacterium]